MSDEPMFKLKNIANASLHGNQTTSKVLVEAESIGEFNATNNKTGLTDKAAETEKPASSDVNDETSLLKKLLKKFSNYFSDVSKGIIVGLSVIAIGIWLGLS